MYYIVYGTWKFLFMLSMQAVLEVQKDACFAGQKVVIVDDLLATGGRSLYCSELDVSLHVTANL